MWLSGFRSRVRAAAVLFHDGCILLNRFGDGVYHNLPGGGIEAGELARQTVVREVREETGLDVETGNLVFTLEYGDPAHHQVSFFFRCELLGSPALSVPALPDRNPDDPKLTSTPVWLPVGELPGITLVPQVNQNLIRYYHTGVFEPLFYEDPYTEG